MSRKKAERITKEKYEKFRIFLNRDKKITMKIEIREIEKIIGCSSLPNSAYNHKEWWSGVSHPISKIWLEEGYKLNKLVLGEYIILIKNNFNLHHIKDLDKLGFEKAGEWKLEKEEIKYEISEEFLLNKNILYSFISDDEVLYIGKTVMTFKKRMCHYQKPGPSQSTNIKNNKNILELLKKGKKVYIYILEDKSPIYFKGFRLNLAAGLEETLILKFKPKWNQVGK